MLRSVASGGQGWPLSFVVLLPMLLTILGRSTLVVGSVQSSSSSNQRNANPNAVRINKCCEKFEIMFDGKCTVAESVNTTVWEPQFTGRNGEKNVQVSPIRYIIGAPDCGSMQKWPIFHYEKSEDKLILFPDGKLRHLILDPHGRGESEQDWEHLFQADIHAEAPFQYEFEQGQYCLDRVITTGANDSKTEGIFATVCSPERETRWTDSEFLLRKIINPVCHGIAMIILLVVAIVYFVLPTLRDLVGNIVTSITVCLIISQAADLVRIFTEFGNHVSFIVADSFFYISLLGAFFWLNSMGYYIWKTFRARNVFLRVTDGRKYCWYSGYAWGATATMAGIAIFAHFFLDTGNAKRHKSIFEDQDTIGWLGIAVFFTPIAFIIIVNIFFYVTTLKFINRMNTYGRIHHKLRCNFVMFTLIFIIMTTSWLFLILSWLHSDALLYAHIVVNALQAPALLYVCVLRQKHVTFLLKKSCCYNEPPATSDWGDEMTYMNGGDY
ncbi:probable G-protein coupled receptor Mth-like 5 [Uranotaenia lowii]|uniref:probable G-protein coupled receptor Mth-like 5 n=1 Tax=Uranotaenia lowii TaxID=190385 RepID=UPI002478A4E5|nr:probable G-protein coupled receptor Mth-like 5 [Uranotaenia lowii]XP_055588435.1 probable G-protein coupled receptor Mth-like 5 [Uranotaenia lowii]XP_055588436.1 probable G-protein coupled receptor Mth-like 5 [Uranotaenia lowii]